MSKVRNMEIIGKYFGYEITKVTAGVSDDRLCTEYCANVGAYYAFSPSVSGIKRDIKKIILRHYPGTMRHYPSCIKSEEWRDISGGQIYIKAKNK